MQVIINTNAHILDGSELRTITETISHVQTMLRDYAPPATPSGTVGLTRSTLSWSLEYLTFENCPPLNDWELAINVEPVREGVGVC